MTLNSLEEYTVKSKNEPCNGARSQQRREFIKKSTLVGAGVAAGAMSSTAVAAEISPETTEPAAQKGYQLSQHVLDYYKSADI